MAAFCLSKELADKLKEAAVKGDINIKDMYGMTSVERRSLFSKYIDEDNAKAVNGEFEKAMSSEQQNALKKWAENTFTPKEKKTVQYKDVLTKIDDLNKLGVLNPEKSDAFLQDLVASKLGAVVTHEEAQQIAVKSKKLEETFSKTDGIGIPGVKEKEQLDYLLAKRDMENYLDSLTPSSNLRVATSTIARGNMLFRLPSILVNINSNNIEGAIGTIVRRFAERTVVADNVDQVGNYARFNTNVFRKTGYDLSRMQSLAVERKILGEEVGTAQGKGAIRAIGRWYEDKIFNLTQGLPDVAASSLAFGDRATLTATRIARHEGLRGSESKARSLEIVKDAMSVEPKTEQGKLVRNIAISDAERVTNTDNRIMAKKALEFRKLLNVGDLRFGDMNIPFVKTTANAIQSSLEHSGITVAPHALVDMIKMVKLVQGGSKWGEASKEAFSGFGTTMVRAGLGTTAAFLIANAINPKDYVGIYPTNPKEQELFKLKNAVANSINIGGKYYSLDWLGPLAAPLIGFLNAKKYGTDLPNSAFFYGSGVAYQLLKTPGLDYARQSLDMLQKTLTSTKQTTPKDVGLQLANYFVDFTKSRFIPGIFQSIAELTDNVVRDTSSKNDILAPLKSVIPGLRETLPVKKTAFGDQTATEGWGALLLGGRGKTATDNKLVTELSRLGDNGQLPSLSDIQSSSQRARDLKTQIGDKQFAAAKDYYQGLLKAKVNTLIDSSGYKKLDDEKKKAQIEKVKSDALDQTLQKYHYKKPKPKK